MNSDKKTAIYSRKSKFTGKGESIGNQIEICTRYIQLHDENISANEILVFEDEGFSGGNINRPQFRRMMEMCRDKKISRIVCYRLDRISRNTGDFINLINELDNLGIEFVSIRDNFETHTPTGRAMMMMTSVFAQLERETIAERIRDNMYELAKDGRWLGGTPPTGYRSVETTGSITVDGKSRKAHKLEIVENEAELVRLIFDKFLELKSITAVETYLIQNDVMTKNSRSFTRFSIKNILRNPVYMKADEDARNYFQMIDGEIYGESSDFDGIHGMMAYNKTRQQTGKKNEIRDIKDWIIAVGKHEGIISGCNWSEAQKLLNQNKSKSYRKPRSNVALLSGILYCGKCGNFMRPKLSQRKNKNGELIYDYLCELKEKSKSKKCDMKRPNGNELDRRVCEELKKLSENKSEFMKMLKKEQKNLNTSDNSYQEKLVSLRRSKCDTGAKIQSLVQSLSTSDTSTAREYIIKEIEKLDGNVKSLESQIQEYEELAKTDSLSGMEFDRLAELLISFAETFDIMTVEQKRNAIRAFVHKIVWDGENIHIYLFGSNSQFLSITEPLCDNCNAMMTQRLILNSM